MSDAGPPIPAERIAGVVLAGGESRRFGRDKAEEFYCGRKLIDWSIAALAPHCDLILVSGHAHADHDSVADAPTPGLGPLGGLAGAMHAAAAKGYSHILTLPCDTPHVPDALLERMRRSERGAYLISCPVIGFWPVDDADRLAAHLLSGASRAVRAWTDICGGEAVESDLAIANINHVEDIERLGAIRTP